MSNLEEGENKCRASAQKVTDALQEGDIVIFLWSWSYQTRQPFFRLATGATISPNQWEFLSHRIKHPKSGEQILLLSAPDLWRGPSRNKVEKAALKDISTHMTDKTVNFTAHIWVQPVIGSDAALRDDGVPTRWSALKWVLEGLVGMDQVTIVLTGWEEISLEQGEKEEARVQKALIKDVEGGLTFTRSWLLDQDFAEAWVVIEAVIEQRTRAQLDLLRTISSGAGWKRKVQEARAEIVQTDLNKLTIRLNQSSAGKQLLQQIEGHFARFAELAKPLEAILGAKDMIGRKKIAAETELKEEYEVFCATVRDFFDEIKKLGVPIGEYLEDFYGYEKGTPLPPPKKMSIIKRWVLELTY